jgi:hypothetical protein
MGCGVFKRGIQNWKDFCIKINIPKGNNRILRDRFISASYHEYRFELSESVDISFCSLQKSEVLKLS